MYSSAKNDFLSIESLERLRDLTTINYDDKLEVRERLMSLFGCDLGLRLNEFLSLQVSDVQKDSDGELFIDLRAGIQKGRKDEDVMYFYYDETKELLERYLSKVRKKFKPKSDYLILSSNGDVYNSQACRTQMKALYKRMGIKTFYGKEPTPHILRHTFATLNIEPLGLALPLSEIMHRLRHTRQDTAKKHYIHNNPYLKKIKHKVYRNRAKKKTPSDILNNISLADFEHWLSDILRLDSSTITTIRRQHKRFIGSTLKEIQDVNESYVLESEVIERLKHLDVPIISLRKYADELKAINLGFKGTYRHGKDFRYKAVFIEDLAKNWISAKVVRDKLKLPRTNFWNLIKKEKWRVKQIGKYSFVHRDDCL